MVNFCTCSWLGCLAVIAIGGANQPHSVAGDRKQSIPIRLGISRLCPTGPRPNSRCLLDPSGKLLATAETFGVALWHLPSGTLARQIPLPRAELVEPITWSSDGRWLVVLEHQLDQVVFSIVNVKTGNVRFLKDDFRG